jgi:hypothetical protein
VVGVRGDFSGVGICCCQSRQVSLDVLPSFRCSIWRGFVGFEVGVGFGGSSGSWVFTPGLPIGGGGGLRYGTRLGDLKESCSILVFN